MVDVTELEDSVSFCKRRIKAVKVSVSELEARIQQYDDFIARGGAGYDVEGLKESNEHAQAQIDRLMQEISNMQTQIARNREMIDFLETKASLAEGIVIDADADD